MTVGISSSASTKMRSAAISSPGPAEPAPPWTPPRPSGLHGLQDAAHDRADHVALLGFDTEGVNGQPHRADVLSRDQLARRVDQAAHVSGAEQARLRLML